MVDRHIVLPRSAAAGSGAALAIAATADAPQGLAAEVITMPISSLSTFERAAQRRELQARAETELKKVLSKEDAPKAVRCFTICFLHQRY
jgi:hypothetical protein